ncbi:hypothetical protein CAMRE0001_2578 [Campylobacter rectus RM3267]|uniref:Uncharacterized protein n=1 Tax=Campylobacter rectus RM3267 TaxID=553218 RepID=B9D3W0_CAMRE|nr:hypothetical protein CAMRE0001_2578 [Campylobacter rectus RM3267]
MFYFDMQILNPYVYLFGLIYFKLYILYLIKFKDIVYR